MTLNLEHQVKMLNNVLHESARFMQRDFGEITQLQSSKKGVQDFTRKCYSRLESKLSTALAEKRPQYGISLASGESSKNCEYFFVLEPIAGIMNFQRSIPFCCSAIALFKQDPKDPEALVIAIHNPILRETFYAAKGLGAWFENYTESIIPKSRIRVSSQNNFADAFVATSIAANKFNYPRNLGSSLLEMAYLAAGRFDIIINKYEDLLTNAGLMLIREAGGYVNSKNDSFLASNDPLHKQAIEIFNNLNT